MYFAINNSTHFGGPSTAVVAFAGPCDPETDCAQIVVVPAAPDGHIKLCVKVPEAGIFTTPSDVPPRLPMNTATGPGKKSSNVRLKGVSVIMRKGATRIGSLGCPIATMVSGVDAAGVRERVVVLNVRATTLYKPAAWLLSMVKEGETVPVGVVMAVPRVV